MKFNVKQSEWKRHRDMEVKGEKAMDSNTGESVNERTLLRPSQLSNLAPVIARMDA